MTHDRRELRVDHPSREEWVAYLYGESDARDQSRLTAHLHDCAECRGQVEAWRKTMYALNAWELAPASSRARAVVPQWVPVAAAAAFALFIGIGAARVTAPKPVDVDALRAELGQNLRQEIGAEWRTALALTSERMYSDLYTQLRDDVDASAARAVMLTRSEAGRAIGEFARLYEEDQTRSRTGIAEIIQYVDEQRVQDVAELRSTVRSLASATGHEFQRTQRRLDAITPIVRVAPAGARD